MGDRRPGGRTATLTSPMTAEVRSTRTTASVESSTGFAHGPNGDFRTSDDALVIREPCRETDSQGWLKELFNIRVERTQDSIEFTFINRVKRQRTSEEDRFLFADTERHSRGLAIAAEQMLVELRVIFVG